MERLYEEVAYVSYYLHWPYDQVMEMEHRDRQRWVAEVSRINERINRDGSSGGGGGGMPQRF